jgi:hypothetical protein
MLIKITRTYLAVIFILKWDDDDDDYILKKSQGETVLHFQGHSFLTFCVKLMTEDFLEIYISNKI